MDSFTSSYHSEERPNKRSVDELDSDDADHDHHHKKARGEDTSTAADSGNTGSRGWLDWGRRPEESTAWQNLWSQEEQDNLAKLVESNRAAERREKARIRARLAASAESDEIEVTKEPAVDKKTQAKRDAVAIRRRKALVKKYRSRGQSPPPIPLYGEPGYGDLPPNYEDDVETNATPANRPARSLAKKPAKKPAKKAPEQSANQRGQCGNSVDNPICLD